jgi:two-component system chemotaxis response regulator CheB
MISAHTRAGSLAAIRALEIGAVDFIAKRSSVDIKLDELRDEIIRKVKIASRVRPVRNVASRPVLRGTAAPASAAGPAGASDAERNGKLDAPRGVPIVVVAASTGGPAALLHVLPQIPREFPGAIVIAQHMPAPFTGQLAHELAARCAIRVKEAEPGERLGRGSSYICPGFHHLTIDSDHRVRLHSAARLEGECPSANRAMTSAADVVGSRVVGIVLTGMGRDGAIGAQAIKRMGGTVIAQDEQSALVNGMPRAAIETGCVDLVVPLERLAATLLDVVNEMSDARATVRYAS